MIAQIMTDRAIPAVETQLSQSPDAEVLKTKDYRCSILEILADFQKPIPRRFIKTKVLKGQCIEFVA